MSLPTIDYGGSGVGIIGSEFPLMQKLISVWYRVGGFNHWIGRLINLVVSCTGFLAFFAVVKRHSTQRHAFLATIAFMFSLWLTYSRKAMPDTFSVSLVLIGVWLTLQAFDRKKGVLLMVSFALIGLGVLSKIPASVAAAPLVLLMFRRDVSFTFKGQTVLWFVFLVVMPVWFWYFDWVPELVALENNPLFFPRNLAEGWAEIKQYPGKVFEQFSFHSFFSFGAFGFFLIGLVLMIRDKHSIGLFAFGITMVVFFYFVLKTGLVFPLHSYYMVPFVPVMALVLGYGLSKLNGKWAYICLGVICLESVANQHDDFYIRQSARSYLELEDIADSIAPRRDLVICNGGDNPQTMYFLNRRGWSLDNSEIQPETLQEMITDGARYLYYVKQPDQPSTQLPYSRLYESEFVEVYRLPQVDD